MAAKKEKELVQIGMVDGPKGQRDLGRVVFEDEDGGIYLQGPSDEKPKKV